MNKNTFINVEKNVTNNMPLTASCLKCRNPRKI